MTLIRHFPLLLIPLVIYNLYSLGFISTVGNVWGAQALGINLPSGAEFVLSRGGLLVSLGLTLLFFEILKATRTAQATILDHLLSTFVFIIFLVQFIIEPNAATSTFFILMFIAFLDVVAGYTISIRVASRDVTFDRGI
ncbi:MAG: hypothetical protein ABJN04_03310 [Hyphomicrobiales bacterium]